MIDILALKGKDVAADYTNPDGQPAICTFIALRFARLLREQGKQPSILSVKGKPLLESKIDTEPLTPLQYEGRVHWNEHIVCACDGLVYDPMLGEPVAIADYGQRAFGRDLQIKEVTV